MKIEEEKLKELFHEEEAEGFELVESTEFVSEGKADYCALIIKDVKSGKHYRTYVTRCGSYYSDYDFMFNEDCEEVELKEVTVKKWIKKKR